MPRQYAAWRHAVTKGVQVSIFVATSFVFTKASSEVLCSQSCKLAGFSERKQMVT